MVVILGGTLLPACRHDYPRGGGRDYDRDRDRDRDARSRDRDYRDREVSASLTQVCGRCRPCGH